MTELQDIATKLQPGGRKSSWPAATLAAIDVMIKDGAMTNKEIAERAGVPANVVGHRKRKMK